VAPALVIQDPWQPDQFGQHPQRLAHRQFRCADIDPARNREFHTAADAMAGIECREAAQQLDVEAPAQAERPREQIDDRR